MVRGGLPSTLQFVQGAAVLSGATIIVVSNCGCMRGVYSKKSRLVACVPNTSRKNVKAPIIRKMRIVEKDKHTKMTLEARGRRRKKQDSQRQKKQNTKAVACPVTCTSIQTLHVTSSAALSRRLALATRLLAR